MDMNGQWTGTIIYGKEYGDHQNKELYFDVDLIQNNKNITGKSIDINGVGMSPDPALIKGKIVSKKIQFIKQYLSWHAFENAGIKIDKSVKGPQIRYTGTYHEVNQTFIGNWTIIKKVKLFGIIPTEKSNGTGTWNMRRK
jgi:hypothetical protein